MAYLKPPALTRRVVNPLVARFNIGRVATLTVPGRRSAKLRTVPVIPVEVDGDRYLVAPYGESAWVRNLRSAGTGALSRRGRTETFTAYEVPANGRAAILTAYRKIAGRTVNSCFTRLPDAADHPVFRIGEPRERRAPGG